MTIHLATYFLPSVSQGIRSLGYSMFLDILELIQPVSVSPGETSPFGFSFAILTCPPLSWASPWFEACAILSHPGLKPDFVSGSVCAVNYSSPQGHRYLAWITGSYSPHNTAMENFQVGKRDGEADRQRKGEQKNKDWGLLPPSSPGRFTSESIWKPTFLITCLI